MNFNKGAKTRGRGTSFKGALIYYLHDKDTLETARARQFRPYAQPRHQTTLTKPGAR